MDLSGPASVAIIAIALLLAFSENLRQAVTRSHQIGSGLFKDFIFHPIRSFLHWESLTNKMPALVVPEDSTMRKRFNNYLGYERHQKQYDEDFWQRQQDDRNSLADMEQKRRKRDKLRVAGESLSDRVRRKSHGGLSV